PKKRERGGGGGGGGPGAAAGWTRAGERSATGATRATLWDQPRKGEKILSRAGPIPATGLPERRDAGSETGRIAASGKARRLSRPPDRTRRAPVSTGRTSGGTGR